MAFYKCAQCGQIYMTKAKLSDHISTRHSEQPSLSVPDVKPPVVPEVKTETANPKRRKRPVPVPVPVPIVSSKTITPKQMIEKSMKMKENIFFCFACRRTFPIVVTLCNHVIANHREELEKYIADSVEADFAVSPAVAKNEVDADIDYLLGITQKKDAIKRPKFICPCCLRRIFYGMHKQFRLHVDRHLKPYTKKRCKICGVKLKNCMMKAHMKQQHPWLCLECNEPFSSRRELDDHRAKAHRLKCSFPNCDESFLFFSHLRQHERKHRPSCGYCFGGGVKVFDNEEILARHVKTFHQRNPEAVSSCKRCSPAQSFATHDEYLAHRKAVHFTYPCRIGKCLHSFSSSILRERHEAQHETAAKKHTFRCSRCDKSFHLRRDFLRHIRQKHQQQTSVSTGRVKTEPKSALSKVLSESTSSNHTVEPVGTFAEEAPPCHCSGVKSEPQDMNTVPQPFI